MSGSCENCGVFVEVFGEGPFHVDGIHNPYQQCKLFATPAESVFRSGGQTKQYGPRPRIATRRPG